MNDNVLNIIQLIHSDFQLESNEIVEKAKEEAESLYNEEWNGYQQEYTKRKEKLQKHASSELEIIAERKAQRLHRELLTYKNELLNEIFNKAAEKLNNLGKEQFQDYFNSAIDTAKLSGTFKLFIGEHSKNKVDQNMLNNVENSELKLILQNTYIPNKGGFLINNEKVEYNFLFEDLLEDIKRTSGAKIAKEVFEE